MKAALKAFGQAPMLCLMFGVLAVAALGAILLPVATNLPRWLSIPLLTAGVVVCSAIAVAYIAGISFSLFSRTSTQGLSNIVARCRSAAFELVASVVQRRSRHRHALEIVRRGGPRTKEEYLSVFPRACS